jgi:hypothetical protein
MHSVTRYHILRDKNPFLLSLIVALWWDCFGRRQACRKACTWTGQHRHKNRTHVSMFAGIWTREPKVWCQKTLQAYWVRSQPYCLLVWTALFHKLCSYFVYYTKCVKTILNTSHSCVTQQRTASWGTIQHFNWLHLEEIFGPRKGTEPWSVKTHNVIINTLHSRLG